jgi:hypothetical protein
VAEYIPVFLAAGLAYWSQRLQRRSDRTEERQGAVERKSQEIDLRLARAEEKIHGTAGRVTRTETSIEDIRDNMVRREDLDDLRAFIKELVK